MFLLAAPPTAHDYVDCLAIKLAEMLDPGHKKTLARIGHFTVVYLVAKPLIWSEAEGDLVVLETRI